MNKKIYNRKIIKRAVNVLKHPELSIKLVKEIKEVLTSKAKLSVKLNGVRNQLYIFGRLLNAYAKGQYRDISLKSMLVTTAVLIYFVTPMDLIPDFIPVSGYLDDATLILWLYNHLGAELKHFMDWESNKNDNKPE